MINKKVVNALLFAEMKKMEGYDIDHYPSK